MSIPESIVPLLSRIDVSVSHSQDAVGISWLKSGQSVVDRSGAILKVAMVASRRNAALFDEVFGEAALELLTLVLTGKLLPWNDQLDSTASVEGRDVSHRLLQVFGRD